MVGKLAQALNGTHAGADDAAIAGLLAAWNAPVAVWVDSKARIRGGAMFSTGATTTSGKARHAQPSSAEAVLRAAAALPAPQPLVVIVLHALPNRKCHSVAPTSEICCHYTSSGDTPATAGACDYAQSGDATDCEVGLGEYKADVVDVLAALLAEYEQRVPVAAAIPRPTAPSAGGLHLAAARRRALRRVDGRPLRHVRDLLGACGHQARIA